jgi:hypothetical protein
MLLTVPLQALIDHAGDSPLPKCAEAILSILDDRDASHACCTSEHEKAQHLHALQAKTKRKDSVQSLPFLAQLNQSWSMCGKVKLELTLGLGGTGPS